MVQWVLPTKNPLSISLLDKYSGSGHLIVGKSEYKNEIPWPHSERACHEQTSV